jgi:hypothetical protein
MIAQAAYYDDRRTHLPRCASVSLAPMDPACAERVSTPLSVVETDCGTLKPLHQEQ